MSSQGDYRPLGTVAAEWVKKFVERLDKDKDTYLTLQDVARYFPEGQEEEMFKEADRDGDGRIDYHDVLQATSGKHPSRPFCEPWVDAFFRLFRTPNIFEVLPPPPRWEQIQTSFERYHNDRHAGTPDLSLTRGRASRMSGHSVVLSKNHTPTPRLTGQQDSTMVKDSTEKDDPNRLRIMYVPPRKRIPVKEVPEEVGVNGTLKKNLTITLQPSVLKKMHRGGADPTMDIQLPPAQYGDPSITRTPEQETTSPREEESGSASGSPVGRRRSAEGPKFGSRRGFEATADVAETTPATLFGFKSKDRFETNIKVSKNKSNARQQQIEQLKAREDMFQSQSNNSITALSASQAKSILRERRTAPDRFCKVQPRDWDAINREAERQAEAEQLHRLRPQMLRDVLHDPRLDPPPPPPKDFVLKFAIPSNSKMRDDVAKDQAMFRGDFVEQSNNKDGFDYKKEGKEPFKLNFPIKKLQKTSIISLDPCRPQPAPKPFLQKQNMNLNFRRLNHEVTLTGDKFDDLGPDPPRLLTDPVIDRHVERRWLQEEAERKGHNQADFRLYFPLMTIKNKDKSLGLHIPNFKVG